MNKSRATATEPKKLKHEDHQDARANLRRTNPLDRFAFPAKTQRRKEVLQFSWRVAPVRRLGGAYGAERTSDPLRLCVFAGNDLAHQLHQAYTWMHNRLDGLRVSNLNIANARSSGDMRHAP